MSNLLPQIEKEETIKLYRMRYAGVVIIAFATLAFTGGLLLFPSLFYLKSSEEVLLSKKNSLSGRETSGIQESLISALKDINTRLSAFPEESVVSPISQSFIDPVLKAKTSEVHLTGFNYSARPDNKKTADVRIIGVADNREALLVFSGNLSKTNGVTDVDVPITSFLKNSDVLFTVSATIAVN